MRGDLTHLNAVVNVALEIEIGASTIFAGRLLLVASVAIWKIYNHDDTCISG
jgi:hypothetical protein